MKNIVFFFITFFLYSCNSKNCEESTFEFATYQEALNVIQNTSFEFEDETTKNSSWIENAKYFSCDMKTGFLIIETSNQEYIHKDVPIEIWEEFNSSESLGKYYNRKIKNRYYLRLEK